MPEPIVTKAWLHEAENGEEWQVEIEHDCMSDGAPFTVTIMAKTVEYRENAETVVEEILIDATPEEAREMATALADKANRRREAIASGRTEERP